ncbi:MAG: Class SAM-dependent methyltransferase [Chloroflexota bacterium]|nr:Class SAM-dependent methyltransferase [Chloroflexota bacterium]
MQDTKQLVENLDTELAALIKKYHSSPAISLSSYKETRTGNRYQSLNMRGDVLKGFRAADRHIYTGIPLEGLSIVDLGCNTGEKTRYAADMGASFAEGIEYEELFVRIGNLVSAYNRYGNVVLRQGDLTNPNLLRRHYDIGASFSSFVYLGDTLQTVLSHIDRMFICETHALGDNWFRRYVRPITRKMPHWLLYGFTDHGGSHTDGRRALVLCSKDTAALSRTIFTRAAELPADNQAICTIDVETSTRPQTLVGKAPAARKIVTALRDTLGAMQSGDRDAVVEALDEAALGLEDTLTGDEPYVFGNDAYWAALFRGAVTYHRTGAVDESNACFNFVRQMTKDQDIGMQKIMTDAERGRQRIALRLDGFLAALTDRTVRDHLIAFNPIPVELLPPDVQMNKLQMINSTGGRTYTYQAFDGYHRLAACWLTKTKTCTVYFCWTNMLGLTTQNLARLADEDGKTTRIEGLIDKAVQIYALQGA